MKPKLIQNNYIGTATEVPNRLPPNSVFFAIDTAESWVYGADGLPIKTLSGISIGTSGSVELPTTNVTGTLSSTGTVETSDLKLSALNTAPASAGATGVLGEIRITADFIYVCVGVDTWVRASIATWV